MTSRDECDLKRARERARRHANRVHWHNDIAGAKELFTDENLVGWAAACGLDVTDLDELIRATAVGLTVRGWRNTELANVHSGYADSDELDALERRRTADATIDTYTAVEDPAEAGRIDLLLEGIADGYGIPDDVMFRANASTARDVRHVLSSETRANSAGTGPDHYFLDDAPPWLEHTIASLADPEREVAIGGFTVAARALLADGWDDYLDDLDRKLGATARMAAVIGERRTLQLLAISGASYFAHWYPHAVWAPALKQLRGEIRAGNLAAALYDPGTDPWRPDADDETFWHAATNYPHLLNARQARFLIWHARTRDHTLDQWAARRRRLSDRATEGFIPFPFT